MVLLKELLQKCPATAWAQHRFHTNVDLVNGKQIVIRYEVPRTPTAHIEFTAAKVAESFSSVLGDAANDPEVCDSLAYLLNQRMAQTFVDVAMHLKLVAATLTALGEKRYLLAWLMLRSLGQQLMAYQGELWLYEWPEWVTLVEQYVLENADDVTRQIISNMSPGI